MRFLAADFVCKVYSPDKIDFLVENRLSFFVLILISVVPNVSFGKDLNIPFDRYSVKDSLGRSITYFLSKKATKKLPLAVSIQGSGCFSIFQKKSDGRISGGQQNLLLKVAKKSHHVLVVEKPGIRLFDAPSRPGTAINCRDEFKREHTLERWRTALDAAIDHARNLAKVERASTLVVGHSEGAIMAAALAAKFKYVTHAAILSGSGPTQLYDHVNRVIKRSKSPKEEVANVASVYGKFRKIKANPNDWQTMEWGHPFRRWASFFSFSTIDLLKSTKARLYVAHGTKDGATPIEGFDVLRSELAVLGKDVRFERRQDADHSLNKPGQKSPEGKLEVFENVIKWFNEKTVANKNDSKDRL